MKTRNKQLLMNQPLNISIARFFLDGKHDALCLHTEILKLLQQSTQFEELRIEWGYP